MARAAGTGDRRARAHGLVRTAPPTSSSGGSAVLDGVRTLDAPNPVRCQPSRCSALARRASRLADDMRFDLLYDRRRRIFAIGYRLADADGPGRARRLVLRPAGVRSAARELRRHRQGRRPAASLVPPRAARHQRQRPRDADVVGRDDVRVPDAAAADADAFPARCSIRAAARAVRRQIEYGRERGVPWGISESAYAFTDRAGNYQYRAFGVPGLGLQARAGRRARGRAVRDGARRRSSTRRRRRTTSSGSHAQGLIGRFGFYEALDYRPLEPALRRARRAARRGPVVVRAFFAHHQGMSLVALANVVCHDVFVGRFHARPARAGDRAAAAGARAARGDPVGAAAGRERDARRRRLRCSRRDGSGRRTRPARTRSSCRTAATRRRSPTPAAASARGASWRSPGSATIAPSTPARTTSICATRGRAASGRRPTSRSARSRTSFEATFDLDKVDVSLPRRRFRDAAPGDRVVRGRRRSAAAVDHQPRRSAAGDRGHELRRDRAGAARGRSRAPGLRQAVHRDRVRCRRARASCSAAGRAAPTKRRPGRFTCSASKAGSAARSNGRPIARASSAAAARSANPLALDGRALSGTTGAVLDPIAALRDRVRLAPGAFVRVTFATGVAADRDAALALVAQVPRRQRRGARLLDGVHARAHHAAAPRAERRSGDALRSAGVARVRRRRVVHQPGRPRAQSRSASRNLWGYGISGDLPIVLVRITEAASMPLVRQLLLAQEYWRVKGLRADRRHPERTSRGVSRRDAGVPDARSCRSRAGRAGTTRRAACSCCAPTACPRPIAICSAAVARVVLRGDLGGLAPQLDRPSPWLYPAGACRAVGARLRVAAPADGAVAGAAARHGQRRRRLHARRPRIRHRPRRRSGDAAAMVERAGQPRLRHDGQRVGCRRSPGPATAARID